MLKLAIIERYFISSNQKEKLYDELLAADKMTSDLIPDNLEIVHFCLNNMSGFATPLPNKHVSDPDLLFFC